MYSNDWRGGTTGTVSRGTPPKTHGLLSHLLGGSLRVKTRRKCSSVHGSIHGGQHTNGTSRMQQQQHVDSSLHVVPGGSKHDAQNSCLPGVVNLGYNKDLLLHYNLSDTVLGKGGNGAVRVVTHKETEKQYACKVIPKVLGEGFSDKKKSSHVESIRREITVLQKLIGCLNVVELHDVYEDDDNVYIIMEWCTGGELWHRVGDRHYSERTVASFMRGVLRTLAVMHSHNILHRDVKPGNFMLLNDSDDSPLKAIDFGLAMPFEPESLPMTNLGLEGTPWFMAPEVLSHQVTPASDVWAAGVMAHELLTGMLPFDDRANPNNPSLSVIWKAILTEDVDFSKPRWNEISSQAQDFIKQLLERDPQKRLSAKQALEHPWLRGNKSDRSAGKQLARSVVQRIQRYAQGGIFKRTVLQSIVAELMSTVASSDELAGAMHQGKPLVATPNAAILEDVFHQLSLDKQNVGVEDLARRLKAMGFKLEASEVARLLEQVDVAHTGQLCKTSFAASQLDWHELQKNHSEHWMQVVKHAFQALDRDRDGLLKPREIAQALLNCNLPEHEVQQVVSQVMEERRRYRPHGALHLDQGLSPSSPGMNFDEFVDMLRVGSLDTLDIYDDGLDRGFSPCGSVDKLNELMQRTSSSGLSSVHKQSLYYEPGGSRDASVHKGVELPKAADIFRFDTKLPAGAVPAELKPAADFFRFDVKPGQPAALAGASKPAADFFRFDVKLNTDQDAAALEHAAMSDASSLFRFDVAGQAVAPRQEARVHAGGHFDRRHRGSSLYKNVVMAGMLPAGGKLAAVQE